MPAVVHPVRFMMAVMNSIYDVRHV
jgi:hypothetical protein